MTKATKVSALVETGRLRTQKEANNTWSVYFGGGFVTGGYRTESEAINWIDRNAEYFVTTPAA